MSSVNVVSSNIRVMQIFVGVREIWGLKQGSGDKIIHFLALSVDISKTVSDRPTAKVTINDK